MAVAQNKKTSNLQRNLIIGFVVLSLLAYLAVRTSLYEPFKVASTSMAPSLERGSLVLVQKNGFGNYGAYGVKVGHGTLSAPVRRGDIMAFEFPKDRSQVYIKRVMGVPGDHIEVRDRSVYVNGKNTRLAEREGDANEGASRESRRYRNKIDKVEFDTLLDSSKGDFAMAPEEEVFKGSCTFSQDALRCEVPKDSYFVMGDNRDNSLDSRYWGFVRSELMVGKVTGSLF